MAELVVNRALRRAEKVSSAPGAAVGVHTMELVKKSKRKSQPKLWLKQVQNVLIADSRVTLDRNSQMWIAATLLGATATTNIPSIPTTSPTWATEVSNSIVEQILKDPRGQPGHLSLVKQLSKQHAKDMTPQAWKRAVVIAMRKDPRVRIEKRQVFPAERPNGGISSSSALSAGIKAKPPLSAHLMVCRRLLCPSSPTTRWRTHPHMPRLYEPSFPLPTILNLMIATATSMSGKTSASTTDL